ncbi:hypothetical protein PGT21_037078 [Puccinia graminis f. sp. tritici]|uniref:Uncharacterized protein n=2 Tax=Puccinia graminis f. sp. tritici TaxID=56615 RepID=E3JYA4_PUCGT|nr:uncharacterized protein PGTG_02490 [Puccinia graminis f. sp. tritici CRL 75-36-700-3]XP_003335256.1 uncharacterized protein PGTG_17036 [Puccinia graminis f. sp. tritici CRL 75-36-700-3]KAA1069877.1 hypothetical protein PGT21_034867 [Puccinia graminis f. sp. tritici]EFP77029.1 hypothetical protein PGTG_02490 [Puccinia graminis f. sp. tritici CRL 75-36-700-3]EFP90837.1 hypothetical protein PGTG_17036 [Puccinia graminis f. sp. tritici CRL 75-36-700-3]KAA1111190.1 hypothetical protein PGT21_037
MLLMTLCKAAVLGRLTQVNQWVANQALKSSLTQIQTSESDDSDHPFRKVPKTLVVIQHDNKEEKPQIVSSKETSPEALIDAQSELPKDDDNGTPAETRPLLSPPIKPESEPETEHTTISMEQN